MSSTAKIAGVITLLVILAVIISVIIWQATQPGSQCEICNNASSDTCTSFCPVCVEPNVETCKSFCSSSPPPETTKPPSPSGATKLPSVGGGGLKNQTSSSLMCNSSPTDYISSIIAYTGKFVNGLKLACKEGAKTLTLGREVGTQNSVASGPISSLTGRAGSWLDNIAGFGGTTGSPWTATCPANMKMIGMDAKADSKSYVSQLTPYCA